MTRNFPFLRVFAAGIVASFAMLAFMMVMPRFGGPELDVFGLLSTLTTQYGSWVPAGQYFLLSIFVFPLLYAGLLYKDLPGPPHQKGLVWGLILFALRGIIVMPVMGQGFFAVSADHAIAALIELGIAHCIYGLLLGAIVGELYETRHRQRAYARHREPERLHSGDRHR